MSRRVLLVVESTSDVLADTTRAEVEIVHLILMALKANKVCPFYWPILAPVALTSPIGMSCERVLCPALMRTHS